MEVSQAAETTPQPSVAPSSSTTVAPRVVGDPLPVPVYFGSGAALLLAIGVFGFVMRRRTTQAS